MNPALSAVLEGLNRLSADWMIGIAWGLAGSLLLFGAVGITARWNRKGRPLLSASLRCVLWWLVLAKLAFTFVSPLLFPAAHVALPLLPGRPVTFLDKTVPASTSPTAYAGLGASAEAGPVSDGGETPFARQTAAKDIPRLTVSSFLFLFWCIGAMFCLLRAAAEAKRQSGILRETQPLENTPTGGMLRLLSLRLRLTSPPRLRVAARATSPLLIGPVHPTILLPEWYGDLSREELEMALAHELAHVRRADLWWGWMPFLARVLAYPLPYITSRACREWEAAREAACDHLALQVTGAAPSAYGRLLVSVLKRDETSGRCRAAGTWVTPLGATAAFHTLSVRLDLLRSVANIAPAGSLTPSQRAAATLLASGAGLLVLILAMPWRLKPAAAVPGSNAVQVSLTPALRYPAPAGVTDIADIPAFDIAAGGDANKRYLLIGGGANAETLPPPPPGGYRLLVVLPGGDGGVEFSPFLRRIERRALGDGYLIAELVAHPWDKQQFRNIVWPTHTNPWPRMRFSTEEFARAVVRDVSARFPIDRRYIFGLGWASGGPSSYALPLDKDAEPSPFTGAFVAMSVYNPALLPSPENAKGKAFFILHPSETTIIPREPARKAAAALRENGAHVEMVTYEGSYGWGNDTFGQIRRGIRYLEDQQVDKGDKSVTQ